jgi:hypothetical protein
MQQLTSLSLQSCTLPDSLQACGLHTLRNLQRLRLVSVAAGKQQITVATGAASIGAAAAALAVPAQGEGAAAGPAAAAPHAEAHEAEAAAAAQVTHVMQDYEHVAACGVGSSLQALVQLTHLELHYQQLSAGDLAGLDCLQQLQHLELWCCPGIDACSSELAVLPGSLTLLQLYNASQHPQLEFTAAAMPGVFSASTGLRHLSLTNVLAFEPALLRCLTGLTSFRLEQESVVDGVFNFEPPDEAGDVALLDALPQLQQLKQLQLIGLIGSPPHEQIHRYAALFAASGLTELSLIDNHLDSYFGAAVFAPGVRLPLLQRLRMGWGCGDNMYDLMGTAWSGSPHLEEWPLGPSDVDGLVRCCPNLQQLWLTTVVAPGTPMGALTALTGLTELAVGGDVIDDDVAVNVLGHMTQLKGELAILFSRTLSLAGWRQMNAMLGTEVPLNDCRALDEYHAEDEANSQQQQQQQQPAES